MATFVLVHGAWRAGWCYRRVADILRSRGHTVYTPTLTGLGPTSHQLSGAISLTTHIRDIVGLIEWEELHQVVLVGHSYGGIPITGTADLIPDKIASLVYLDAFVPENNQCLLDMVPPEEALKFCLSAASNGGFGITPLSLDYFNVNAGDRAWVEKLTTLQPLGTFTQRLQLTGAHTRVRKKTYVTATDYETPFGKFTQKFAADPAWISRSIDCGHDLMLDRPQETADLIEEASRF